MKSPRGDLAAHPIVDPTISRRLFVIYSGERALSESERGLVNSLRRKLSEPRQAERGLNGPRTRWCATAVSRQGAIERLDRLIDDRRAGRDRFAIRPFLRSVALALAAGHENHGRRRDTAHESRIVTGPARQIHFTKTEIVRALAQRGAQIRIAGDRRTIRQGLECARSPAPPWHAPALSRSMASTKRAVNAGSVVRASMTSRQRPGTMFDADGLDRQDADGGDEIVRTFGGQLFGDPAHRSDGLGRRNESIMTQRHRRGAGVIGLALEHDFDSTDADDRGHHADIERPRFKHDALLDMQFEERADIVAPGLFETVGIAADPAQGVAQCLAAGPGEIEHLGVERAGHAAAADAGEAVFARLLGKEVDDFDG